MTRITKSDLSTALSILVREIGGHVAGSYDDPGGYFVSKEPSGWIVYQQMHDGTGLREPFGSRRRTASELHNTLTFAADAVRISKQGG